MMKEEEEDLVTNMKNLILNNGTVDKLLNENSHNFSFQGEMSTFLNSTLMRNSLNETTQKPKKQNDKSRLMLLNPHMESFLSFGEERLNKTKAKHDLTGIDNQAPLFDPSRFFDNQFDDQ